MHSAACCPTRCGRRRRARARRWSPATPAWSPSASPTRASPSPCAESAMDAVWDGITRPETLTPEAAAVRQRLADAAKAYDWPRTFEILEQSRLANATRPGGHSLYAPLHQAAHGGAPVEVVERLLALGAWRTLQNANGERPVDVAERRGHLHLLPILQPQFRRQVPPGIP